jgi:type III restriction enzyme
MARLRQWCGEATDASQAEGGPKYRFVYVDQGGFERHPPTSFAALVAGFIEYQS